MGIISRVLKSCATIKDSRTLVKPSFKLMEEVGELATEVNIKLGNLPESKGGEDGVLGESCDIILCVLDIVHLSNPNITEGEVIRMLEHKIKKWRKVSI